MSKLTPRANQAVVQARSEAERLGHKTAGPEHLFLSMLTWEQGNVIHILRNLDFELGAIKANVEALARSQVDASGESVDFARRFEKVLELADDEAARMGHAFIGTEHLLLGLAREPGGAVAGVFEPREIKLEQLRAEVIKWVDPEFTSRPPEISTLARLGRLERAIETTHEDISKKIARIEFLIGKIDSRFTGYSPFRSDGLSEGSYHG